MEYRVHTEELAFVVERIARFETALQAAIDDAGQAARSLTDYWSGAAAEAHREAHARWRADIDRMHAALATMRTIADAAHANYTAALAANNAMWSGI